jgi:hypothetical protein
VERVDHLAIGGLHIALHSDERISCRYQGATQRFLTQSPEACDIRLRVRPMAESEPRDGELVFDSGAVWRLFRQSSGFRIECSSEIFGDEPYKIAHIDDSFSRGEIAIRTAAIGTEVDPLEYPLDEVLVAHLLGRGGGVELHGAGLVLPDGRGRLFVGQSGAGKSTTARLWDARNAAVLSDDRIIIRERDGAMRMYGSPWHGEAMLSSPGSAPVTGIYLLTQAKRTEIVALKTAEAVARLFACSFPPFHDASALEFTLGFLETLVGKVPVRELKFTPDVSAVEAVEVLS